jgi:amino acid transporter
MKHWISKSSGAEGSRRNLAYHPSPFHPAVNSSAPRESADVAWQPRLSLWDAASLMISIVVGTSIFVAPPMVFSSVNSAAVGVSVWVLGGVLSLIGGLVFAEMAVALPKGGAYTYLTTAFGPSAGLVYGVAQLSIIVTATIGSMAFAFAQHGDALARGHMTSWPAAEWTQPSLALGVVLLLAVLNTRNLQFSKHTQNVFTSAKLLGLGAVAVAGLVAASKRGGPVAAADAAKDPNIGLAMVLVLYAYGGWSDSANVAAEVRNRARNIPIALAGGLLGVTAIYAVVNMAYLAALGLGGVRQFDEPARQTLATVVGPMAGDVVTVLVMISAVGGIHGMLFSGSRSIAALGENELAFRRLSQWHPVRGVPAKAVWALAVVSLLQIALVGTSQGRHAVDTVLLNCGREAVPWDFYRGGFGTLVAASAPTFWLLMLIVGAAFFRLRSLGISPKEFRCPGSPVTPLIYCGTCLFMLWSSIQYAGMIGLIGLLPCVIASVVAIYDRGKTTAQE